MNDLVGLIIQYTYNYEIGMILAFALIENVKIAFMYTRSTWVLAKTI